MPAFFATTEILTVSFPLLMASTLHLSDLPHSEVKLQRLTVEKAKEVVQKICVNPRVNAADARTISQNFGCNPQVGRWTEAVNTNTGQMECELSLSLCPRTIYMQALNLVAHALKNGRMAIDEAKASAGLISHANRSRLIEQKLECIVDGIKRSLESQNKEVKRMLIRLALMLPGPFQLEVEALPEVSECLMECTLQGPWQKHKSILASFPNWSSSCRSSRRASSRDWLHWASWRKRMASTL
jgi:hypothetical protein